jgi:HAMP domain-containing protein
MKLLAKFNLIFLAVFAVGLAFAAYVAKSFLESNARSQVVEQARLMMELTLSTRRYTVNQVRPILNAHADPTVFQPQTVPAYAATETFRFLHNQYPEYTYKEATLNPTNLQDRAADWESDVINNFRNQSAQTEFLGERETPAGRSLFLARPIKTDQTCAQCHSTPDAAPPAMIKAYGTANGFGWKTGEIVGAQIVSVPMALPFRLATAAFKTLMTSLLGVAAFILLALNALLILTVIRPVSKLSTAADEISQGNLEVPEQPVTGKDEISVLADAFNRMHRSLVKAVKLLESES